MNRLFSPSRRELVAGLALFAPAQALAVATIPPGGRLAFAVYRNGAKIGEHAMRFSGEPGAVVVTTDVSMIVRLGPVPVYRYAHHAVERWSAGRFSSLDTTTNGNGRKVRVDARRTATAVEIQTGTGRFNAPATALPLTHWNPDAFTGPMFNPQEGKLLKATGVRKAAETLKVAGGKTLRATRWSVRGDTEIDDWYDEAGVWVALQGKLKDGSTIEYRRL